MYRASSRDFTGFTGAARVRSSTASVHATRHVGHRADDSVAPAALVPSSLRTRGFSSSPRLRTRRVQVKREWRRGFTASTATWRATVDPGNRVVALRGTATRRRPRRRQRPPLLGKAVRRKDRPSGFVIHQNAGVWGGGRWFKSEVGVLKEQARSIPSHPTSDGIRMCAVRVHLEYVGF